MNKQKLERSCPICQNTVNGEILHTQRFVLPAGHILPDAYDVVACGKCGFVYADSSANQDQYDRYYASMSKYDRDYINADNLHYVKAATWLSAFLPDKKANILEIGCGNGQLLLELKKMGYLNLTAFDSSEKCIAFIQSQGIPGRASSIFEVSDGQQYDCLILLGILEHILDLSKAMRILRKITKPGGHIFVGVPDASRYSDFDTVPFDYFNIEHINHFDETALIHLSYIHGLDVVGFLKTSLVFSRVEQPVLFCMYQNSGKEIVDWQNYSKISILNYLAKTKENNNIHHIIDELVESKEEVIVWGVGNYTNRLLATSHLDQCHIILWVDNDRHKQGTSINGMTVQAPEAILNMSKKAVILVAIAVFYDEILLEIKRRGIENKVVVLK